MKDKSALFLAPSLTTFYNFVNIVLLFNHSFALVLCYALMVNKSFPPPPPPVDSTKPSHTLLSLMGSWPNLSKQLSVDYVWALGYRSTDASAVLFLLYSKEVAYAMSTCMYV